MKKTINALIPLILFFLLLHPLYAAESDLDNRVLKFTLKNGMRVLLLERHLSPTVSMYIRQRAGAVDENRDLRQIAHAANPD